MEHPQFDSIYQEKIGIFMGELLVSGGVNISPFSRGRRKEWRRRRVGLLVVDVLLIPCALSWRRSGV